VNVNHTFLVFSGYSN